MNFIKYIKKPFKYDYDLCKESIAQSLIMIGISFVMNMILLLIICSKVFDSIALLTSLVGLFMGKEKNIELGASGYIELILILLLIFAAFICGLAGLILLLRKNRGLASNYTESMSIVATSLLLPSLALIVPIFFILIKTGLSYKIAILTYVIVIFVSLFNLIESLKAVGLGTGISSYVVSSISAVFYFLNIYVPLRVVFSLATKSITSGKL